MADELPSAPAKRTRAPVKFTPAHAERIIDQIAHGKPLTVLCREPGMPAWRTVYDNLDKDPEFAARFRTAREMGADMIAEMALEDLQAEPRRIEIVDQDGKTVERRVDPGWVQWQRIVFEGRLKLLSKWCAGKYGDRLQVDGGANMQLLVITGVRDAAASIADRAQLALPEPEAEVVD